MNGLRIFGIALAVLGLAAAAFPSWFGPLTGGPGAPVDVFEAVERRVRGGMLLGIGLCFIAITALSPWSTSLPTAIFYFMAGALAARILGLMIDGVVPKQWLLVAVEAVVMAIAALWLWRNGGEAP
jgi:multisubunit Na+/H+ antiporter MnhB subunit